MGLFIGRNKILNIKLNNCAYKLAVATGVTAAVDVTIKNLDLVDATILYTDPAGQPQEFHLNSNICTIPVCSNSSITLAFDVDNALNNINSYSSFSHSYTGNTIVYAVDTTHGIIEYECNHYITTFVGTSEPYYCHETGEDYFNCDLCGTALTVTNDTWGNEHADYDRSYIPNGGDHDIYCDNCKTYIGSESCSDHLSYEEYNFDWHRPYCSLCEDGKALEHHNFVNGICVDCSYECIHGYGLTPNNDMTHICEHCGKVYQHNYRIGELVSEATCTEYEYRKVICDDCGHETVAGIDGSALGHNYLSCKCTRCGDINHIDWVDYSQEPTCGSSGYEYGECHSCGEHSEWTELPATGNHNYNMDGFCEDCGVCANCDGRGCEYCTPTE